MKRYATFYQFVNLLTLLVTAVIIIAIGGRINSILGTAVFDLVCFLPTLIVTRLTLGNALGFVYGVYLGRKER